MSTRFEEIEIGKVHANAANIRQDMGDMEDLVEQVKTFGILSPLRVYPHPVLVGDYLVQDGHRRLEAAQTIGALFVPCNVVDAPKRGPRADIEVMLSTGQAAKVLNQVEVSFAFEQLAADGLDTTTIAKKYKVSRTDVKARARVSSAPEAIKSSFAAGKLSLLDMKRIQDLEDAGVPAVFDEVVAKVSADAEGKWGVNVENVIAEKQGQHERAQLKAELLEAGATEASGYGVVYDGKHDEVTELGLTVAEHAAGKHVFYLTGTEVRWFAKRLVAKREPTSEEVKDAQERRSLDAGLAIQARVRRKFLMDQVKAKTSMAGPGADFDLLFDLMWEKICNLPDEVVADLTDISLPAEDKDGDQDKDDAALDQWHTRVQKKLRSFTWQQLVRAGAIADEWGNESYLSAVKNFERVNWQWDRCRGWYTKLQEKFGYRLDQSEKNAVLWAELKGGVSGYGASLDEGHNRKLSEDLAILDD